MKKAKSERIKYEMIINDTLCDYLTKQARQGWILYTIYAGRLCFKKDNPQDIKFQIEYSDTEYEYDDYLEELGYKRIGTYNNITIYKNNDIYAPDLHSDDEVRLKALKKNETRLMKIGAILMAIGGLPLWFIIWIFLNQPLSLGYIFENILIIIFLLSICLFLLLPIFQFIEAILLKRIIEKITKNEEPNYKTFAIIEKISSIYIYCIGITYPITLIFVLFRFIQDSGNMFINLLTIFGGAGLVLLFGYIANKYRINKKLYGIVFILVLSIMSGIRSNFRNESDKTSKPDPTPTIQSYMEDYNHYTETNDIFVDSKRFTNQLEDNLTTNNCLEDIKICTNEFIAKEVFKSNIVYYENESRATPEAIKELLDKTGEYVTGDIPYYSYEDAVKNLVVYNHILVDECYYNNYFMIARKDNKILISYIQKEDNYINNVIEHYFKGEN